ncbi:MULTISPECIES: ABC transporter ATP-binding protein [Gammaproteobacteria]|jgi:ABC-type branched-subunit amino acid transport system ATPase component|uniref:ABC transporter ATP-binding protein n=5 Tax=Gammaproteobacteria TaxID=1236 RepID=A0ABD4K2G4_9ENTR|nr:MULTISPECIES: ABC transporter ATP-binding protein [Gammaproteobacteria]ELW8202931.1 ABC transporter ATP-binding protein [Yersinia enterocolitica]MCU2364273.1 ABC transporter ATP-binding protein [Enterobacter hormaechei subsp. xiangfangensis]MDU1654984.1 ABC transporter ATP-binding protein [Leclercia adecarboxylata]HBS4244249.1 ABC transporter ATP-binding protein [Klebsiella quasipneumoniae subsp. quasipneumoniae]HED4126573.1 ABC transporter ATP-binding protein [Klebsiella variicola subsp. v
MNQELLSVEGLTSGYGTAAVLRNISLSVSKGEIVVVLGKNGMGKSTLLKTIMGFVSPFSGTVSLDGDDVTNIRPHMMARSGVAHTPQEHTLFPDLTVEENLRLGVASNRLFHERLPSLETLFPRMLERLKQRAGTLSGGEQKMLLMSRGLIAQPKLMLIDEVSEGLQPAMVDRMGEVLIRARDELGIAVLLVEQNLDFALSVANRFMVLKLGEIVEQGDVEDVVSTQTLSNHLAV